jgi:hypothetical protein
MNSIAQLLLVFFLAISMVKVEGGKKRFVFRLDDIQDYYNSQMQIALIDYFMKNNIGVSLGIIGGFFSGVDKPLYAKIKDCLKLGNYRCSLFNHGTDANYIFANAPSVESAKAQVKTCDDRIRALFNYETEIMIPHQNSWGPYLIQALDELGYLAISASNLPYSNMTWNLNTKPIRVPQQTTTAGYAGDNVWTAIPVATTIAQCEAADSRGEDCVIMMHPNEFADGVYTLAMLKQLVDTLQSDGWTSVNFHHIIMEAYGWSEAPTAMPTRPVLQLNSYLTLKDLAAPVLPDVGKTIVQESYGLSLPAPMSASHDMSIVSQSQNSTTKHWQVVIKSLLYLPMDGFLAYNQTTLLAYTRSILTNAVRDHQMTQYLRTRSMHYRYSTYQNTSAMSIGFENTYSTSKQENAIEAFIMQTPVLIGIVIFGVLLIAALLFLWNYCSQKKVEEQELDMEKGIEALPEIEVASVGTATSSACCNLGSCWWFCHRKTLAITQAFGVSGKEDASTLEDSIEDVIDASPCNKELFTSHSFSSPVKLDFTIASPTSIDSDQYHHSRPYPRSIDVAERNVSVDIEELNLNIEQITRMARTASRPLSPSALYPIPPTGSRSNSTRTALSSAHSSSNFASLTSNNTPSAAPSSSRPTSPVASMGTTVMAPV